MPTEEKPIYKELIVRSVSDILDCLKKWSARMVFRGQARQAWDLAPRLSRLYEHRSIPDTWPRLQSFILADFRKHAIPYLKREPENDFEWLATGQHYGLPTRLLDWTSNPLKATYFAVRDDPETDGAMFALAPTSWGPLLEKHEDLGSIGSDQYLMTIYPHAIDSRIIAQESVFTAFPFPKNRERFPPLEDITEYDGSYFYL